MGETIVMAETNLNEIRKFDPIFPEYLEGFGWRIIEDGDGEFMTHYVVPDFEGVTPELSRALQGVFFSPPSIVVRDEVIKFSGLEVFEDYIEIGDSARHMNGTPELRVHSPEELRGLFSTIQDISGAVEMLRKLADRYVAAE